MSDNNEKTTVAAQGATDYGYVSSGNTAGNVRLIKNYALFLFPKGDSTFVAPTGVAWTPPASKKPIGYSTEDGAVLHPEPGDSTDYKAHNGDIVLSDTDPGYWTLQLAGAINSGKETGVYHYARGGNPETEARFFVDNVRGYVHRSVLILDWEAQDNAAWGDKQWPRRWAREVKRLTGVNPIIYTMDSGYWQVAGMETELNCGIWIAQYATNMVTGYQTAPWNIGARGEVMRQYTSNGSLSGWSGRLDLNRFRGDRAAWRKYANPDDKGAANLPSVKPKPQPMTAPTVDLNALATRTIRGDFGNDPARRQALGGNYAAVMQIVNSRLGGGSGGTAATGSRSVVVRSGDTMGAIAERTGLKPVSAWRVPSGDVNRIYPGQIVTYGGASVSIASSGVGGHVVRSGESLWSIYGSGWQSAAARNGIRSPYVIYPGQYLR